MLPVFKIRGVFCKINRHAARFENLHYLLQKAHEIGHTKWAQNPPHQIYQVRMQATEIQSASRTSTINSSAAASRYRLIL